MTIGRLPSGNRWERILRGLALHRPELRAWALYDWANSGMVTVIIATVFSIYRVAGASAYPPEKASRMRKPRYSAPRLCVGGRLVGRVFDPFLPQRAGAGAAVRA